MADKVDAKTFIKDNQDMAMLKVLDTQLHSCTSAIFSDFSSVNSIAQLATFLGRISELADQVRNFADASYDGLATEIQYAEYQQEKEAKDA